MIAVTFALAAESRDFVRGIRGTEHRIGRVRVFKGSLGRHEIEVLLTGVGTGIAEERLRSYLENGTPEFFVSSGFAGATTRGYSVGDVILATNRSDPALTALAEKTLAQFTTRSGILFTSREMVDSPLVRADLWSREQAIAIDMETSSIAEICRERGLPLLSLRVLSDTPEEPFPLPAHVLFDLQHQRTMARRLVRYLVTRPSSLVRLIRFSRQIRRARGKMTEALVMLLENSA
jgi:nucleoside phosphorylase